MRYITGLVGFPIVVAILLFGNTILIDILFAIIAVMSLHEFFDSMKEKVKPVRWVRIFILYINSFYTYNTK